MSLKSYKIRKKAYRYFKVKIKKDDVYKGSTQSSTEVLFHFLSGKLNSINVSK